MLKAIIWETNKFPGVAGGVQSNTQDYRMVCHPAGEFGSETTPTNVTLVVMQMPESKIRG